MPPTCVIKREPGSVVKGLNSAFELQALDSGSDALCVCDLGQALTSQPHVGIWGNIMSDLILTDAFRIVSGTHGEVGKSKQEANSKGRRPEKNKIYCNVEQEALKMQKRILA